MFDFPLVNATNFACLFKLQWFSDIQIVVFWFQLDKFKFCNALLSRNIYKYLIIKEFSWIWLNDNQYKQIDSRSKSVKGENSRILGNYHNVSQTALMSLTKVFYAFWQIKYFNFMSSIKSHKQCISSKEDIILCHSPVLFN